MMNKEKLPKAKRFNLSKNKVKVAIVGGALVVGLGLRHLSKTPSRDVQETKKEQADTNTSKKNNSKTIRYDALSKITYNSAIKISTQQDIEKLFFMAEPLIIQELALEEVAQKNLYNDYGKFKDGLNTVGMGSTYSPLNVKNYDNPNATWFHIYSNPKSFSGFTTDYQKMRDLIVGWAMFRTKTQNYDTKEIETHKTVLARMFEKLQGATLTVHEFSAIFCAVYNNENNIKELCPIIQKHYTNKLKCANAIRTWYSLPHMAKNAGTSDRAFFESLVYLNINNFCNSISDMPTKPSAKASCINVQNIDRDKKLTFRNCVKTSDESKKSFLNFICEQIVRGVIAPLE